MKYILIIIFLFSTLTAKTKQDFIDFDIQRFSYIGDLPKVEKAFKNGANIEKIDDKNMTPLLLAGFKNKVGVVKYLINRGSDINHKSHSGRNILTYAIQNHNFSLVKYLLDIGIEVIKSPYDSDALLTAIYYRELEIVKILLNHYKDLDKDIIIKKDDKHWKTKTTYLLRAIQKDETSIAKLLIENGIDINKANSRGETAVISAMRNKNYELVNYLISKGAKLDSIDIGGNSVLSYAIKAKKENISLKVLQENKNLDLTKKLSYDVAIDKSAVYEEYISKPAEKYLFYTYLHMSSLHGMNTVAKYFIKKGLSLDTLTNDALQLDALGLAVFKGQTKTVKYLIENGANPYKVYNNIHPQGDRGLFYFAGGYKRYSLLALATISQKRDKMMMKYLLSLKDAKDYIHICDDTFYFNIILIHKDNQNEILELVLNQFKSWGYTNKDIENKVDNIFKKHKQSRKKSNKEKTKNELLVAKITKAIKNDDLKTLQKFKKDGIDINKIVPWALFNTLWDRQTQLIQPLIDMGVDVNTKAYISKMSLFHRLIVEHSRNELNNFADIFFTLYKNGLNINEITEDKTPLYEYLKYIKNYDKAFIEKVLKNKATLDIKWWQLRDLLSIPTKNLEYIFSHKKLKPMISKILQDKEIVKIHENKYPKRLEKLFELTYWNNIPLDYQMFFYYLKDKDTEMARVTMYYMKFENK